MKEALHKILSVALVILLLASTTSWSVDKHFCMGHLVDVAFFSDAESCDMNMGVVSEEMKMDCCSDELLLIDGQDDLKVSFDEVGLNQQIFIASLTLSLLELYKVPQQQLVPNNDYPPPLLVQDLQLLDQVFII